MKTHAVAWLGGMLIAAILALAGYDIYRGYHAAVRAGGRELDTQARMIAEQTARSFQAVDVQLRHLVAQYHQGTFARLSREDLRAYLRDQAVGLVQAEGLLLIDSTGALRGSSYLPALVEARVNVTGEGPFEAARGSRELGFVVSSAVKSSADGNWMFVMSRRLESGDGGFAGVIAARGRIQYFQDFYRDLGLEAGTYVNLMKHDGTLLARHPPVEQAYGRVFPLYHQVAAAYGSGEAGPARFVSPFDGIERFGVVRPVPGYPLSVVLTRDVAVALAPWRMQAMGSAGRTFALGALAALLLALLARQLARLYRTRATLEAQQERFALAVAGSADGIWDFDFANRRVFASARARELSGLPPGLEMQPMDEWFASLPLDPRDAERRRAAMQAHLDGRAPAYEGEFRLRQLDGEYRWRRIHGLCTRDAAGRPTRMAGSISDIDARRRAEDALRASEEQYRAVFNASTDALVLRDSEARIVDVNPAFCEMSGYRREEVLGESRWIFAPPQDAALARDTFERVTRGERVRFEARAARKDGTPIHVEVRGVPILYKGRAHSLGMVRDITAQKLAEEALRVSEEQYRAIFNAAADAFVLRDAQARIVDVNPAFLQISGYSREEVLAGAGWVFAVPEMSGLARDMFDRVIGGEPVQFELQARRKDGALIDVEMRAAPIRYRGQAHALGMARDITARKRAEAERARLESQLLQAKKLEAIGTLAGGIAHDFNNILSAILGYGEMAQRGAAEGTALRRHVDAVVSAGMRARSLVARILAFSRSGVGERVPVHVQSVVAEALELVAASLSPGVTLERRLDVADAAVIGDATQIHQVVMNLCANAAQSMKAGGTLTVELDVVERAGGMAATSALAAGRYLCLRVRDTGTGIPPEVLDRIFDPFFTTKGVGVGTGLGLSLVHGIVTDLGGGIEVESREGEGSTFLVYLPAANARAAAQGAQEALPAGAGETVMLVDDEEPLVQLGEEMIAALGYEPVGFTSSRAALEALRADPGRFSVLLSDETMPELAGSELAREARRLRPDLPVVLMTGFISPALAARAREIGVAEVLAKPLTARDIARTLAGVLRS